MSHHKQVFAALVMGLCSAGLAASKNSTVPSKPDYSKEAAIIESYRTAVRFEKNGTGTMDQTVRIRVISDAGVQKYAVLVFGYDSLSESLEVDYVRVTQTDGTVVTTPASVVQDMPSQVTLQAPEYSDYREKHVPVKGLGPGCILEYHLLYRVHSPLVPGQFWYEYDFDNTDVILDEEVEVNHPADRAVKVKSAGVQPLITESGGRRIYLWKSSHLKREEAILHPIGQLPAPAVLISTFQSWEEVGRWWASLEQPQIAPTPEIIAKAAQLTKGLTSNEEKLQAIYSYVAIKFHYIGVSFGIGRYQPHAAGEVLSNSYGDCKDKHTLLASLLSAVGINAYPALINSIRKLDPDVPSPGQFDHVITVVPEGQKFLWMDSTTELAPLGFLMFNLRNKRALVIPSSQSPYLTTTPPTDLQENTQKFDVDAKLADDGTLTAKIKRTTEGDAGLIARLAFRSVPQSQWRDLVQVISRLEGYSGTVSDINVGSPEDTSHPFTYSYQYTREGFPDWKDHQILVALPYSGLAPLTDDPEKANQPVILGPPANAHFEAKIELPKGYTPTVPKPVDLTTSFAEYHSTYSFKDGALYAERRVTIKAEEVPAKNRDEYKRFQRSVSDDESRYIVLGNGAETVQQAMMNPDFRQAMEEAMNYTRSGDLHAALSAAQRATIVEPKSELAWQTAAQLYQLLQQTDEAVQALHKAIALAPQDQRAYQQLASALHEAHRTNEALQVWRDLVQANPQNAGAHAILGSALIEQKQYPDAVAQYETAIKLDPTNWRYEMGLGGAYVAAGKPDQAVPPYEKAVQMDPTPMVWNDVGYDMADRNLDLPEAEHFLKMAVGAAESDASKVSFDKLNDKDLIPTNNLAFFWDSLGWAYFRGGKLMEARKFVEASWDLNQDPVVAAHLGEIDEKLGDKKAAIRDDAEAVAASPARFRVYIMNSPPPLNPFATKIKARLAKLAGENNADNEISKAREYLSEQRSYEFKKGALKPGSADFFVLITAGGQAQGAKFVSGSDELRPAAEKISALHFRQVIPDDSAACILRRGILSCSEYISTCSFVLLLPYMVRSVN